MADKTIFCAPMGQSTNPSSSESNPGRFPSASTQSPAVSFSQSHTSRPRRGESADSTTEMHRAMEHKKPFDINSLMSPPELPPFESFSSYSAVRGASGEDRGDKQTGPRPLLSPPISPFTKAANSMGPSAPMSRTLADPILYPGSEMSSSPPQQPLFGQEETPDAALRLVDEHVATRPATLFQQASPPKRADYELALYFQSAVMEKYTRNPKGWLRKERELLRADLKASASRRNMLHPVMPAKSLVARDIAAKPPRPAPRASKADRIVKPRARPAPQRIAPQRLSPPQRIAPLSSSSPPTQNGTARRLPSATPEPRSRPVAPSREDKDFHLLEDLAPPLASLPNKPNSLKVDWKGNPLDLSNDPHRHLLHPDELQLASSLRLDCATYLTSKRRIFISRLECAAKPKDFRKTDAQQACKIDVNKASKLWQAYDKVGWLDIAWMKPHLAALRK